MGIRKLLLERSKPLVERSEQPEMAVNYSTTREDGYRRLLVREDSRKDVRELLLKLPHVTEDLAAHADVLVQLVKTVCDQQRQIVELEKTLSDFMSAKVVINAADNLQKVVSEALREGYDARGVELTIQARATHERSLTTSTSEGTGRNQSSAARASVSAGLGGAIAAVSKFHVDATLDQKQLQQSLDQVNVHSAELTSAERDLLYTVKFGELTGRGTDRAAPKGK